MNNEAKVIDINSTEHGRKPLSEREQTERILAAIKPGSEEQQIDDLVEVIASVTREVLTLHRAHPDSASLATAQKHSEKLLRALGRYLATFAFNQLPF